MTREKKHAFWGINIDITEDKKFDIDTKEKLLEAMEAFG